MSSRIQFATVLIIVMGISLVAFIGGFILFNYYVMPSVTRQGEEFPIPELRGLTESEAQEVADRLNFRIEVTEEVTDSVYTRGQIALQWPDPGNLVKPGRLVQVAISRGIQIITELSVNDMSQRQARILLNEKNIVISEQSRVYSDQFENDLVINSDPVDVTQIVERGQLSLLTSLGHAPELYLMPAIIGLPEVDARRRLQSFGIVVAAPRYQYDPQAVVGQVIEQDPPAGFTVKKGDTVQLTVNGG